MLPWSETRHLLGIRRHLVIKRKNSSSGETMRLLCASRVAAPLLCALTIVAGTTTLLAHPTPAEAQQSGGVSFGATASPSASGAPAAPPAGSATPAPSASGSASSSSPPPASSGSEAAPPPNSPADATLPLEGDEAQDAARAAEWAERDRMVNESNTITGGTGLLKTQHAETGAPGDLARQETVPCLAAHQLCHREITCPTNHPRQAGALFSA